MVTPRDRVPWRGYWPASPTPFALDGALDLAALNETIDLYVSHGVHGVLVNGTTGEWWAQTTAERIQVAAAAVAGAAGRVPVIVGVSSFRLHDTLELAQAAAESDAAGVLATVPPYVNPTPKESLRWYENIAARSPLPLMVYNWPRGVGVDLSIELLAELARVENIVAIKDSSPDELKTIEALERVGPEVRFFARFISRRGLAVLSQLGGDGNIDGGGIAALLGAGYYEAAWTGDLASAGDLAARYQQVGGALVDSSYAGRFGSPVAQVKAVMRMLDQPGGYVREPLIDVPEDVAKAAVMPALIDSGLLAMVERATESRAVTGTGA